MTDLLPTDDTYVQEYANENTPLGDLNELLLNTTTTGAYFTRVFFKFDISNINLMYVSSVRLYFYTLDVTQSVSTSLDKLATNWDEKTVTWNTKPADLGEISSFYINGWDDNTWNSRDVTNYVKSISSDSVAFQLRPYGYDNKHANISSKEGTHPPFLRITYDTNDYYLSTTGSDSNDGTSWANAWASLLYASHYLYDGDTLHIEYGTYTEDIGVDGIQFPNIGSSGIKLLPSTTSDTYVSGNEVKIELI